MAKTSYAFASGAVRAHETTLLTRQDMDQLLALRTPERVTAALRDKGYGLPVGEREDMEDLLRQERAKLWAYLRSLVPDFQLFAPFLVQNDYQNAQTVLKGILRDRPYAHLLLEPRTVEPALLEAAVRDRKFSALPERLGAALEAAYNLLAHTADTQRSDAVLEAARMAAMVEAAETTGVPLLIELNRTAVFYADIKVALRTARAGKGRELLEAALCPVEGLELSALTRAALSGEEELLNYLETQSAYDCREAAARFREAPAAFEKWVDDRMTLIARRAKTVTLGPEPLLGYLLAKEAEIKDIHILLTGLRAGQEEEQIRERMRLLYA